MLHAWLGLMLAMLPDVSSSDAELYIEGGGNDRFSYAIESGDINGDGDTDLVIAAPLPNTPGGNHVYVFFGPLDLSGDAIDVGSADVVIAGAGTDETGWSIAVGDVLGDQALDLVVASPGNLNQSGTIEVFEGPLSSSSMTIGDATMSIAGTGGNAGFSVAAGDFDGDGKDELAVGAANEPTPDGDGMAYLLDLENAPVDMSEATVTFDGSGLLGFAMTNVGDFNGDGYEDLAIGAYVEQYRSEGPSRGLVALVYGRETFDAVYDIAERHPERFDIAYITGETNASNLGYALESAGDVNGDGYDDLVIGAPAGECRNPVCPMPEDTGRVYLVLGTGDAGPSGGTDRGLHGISRVETVADYIYEGTTPQDWTGISVDGAGYVGSTYSRVNHPVYANAILGPALMLGTVDHYAYVIPYDAGPRYAVMPKYSCDYEPETGIACALDRSEMPGKRAIRVQLGSLSFGGHVFVDASGYFGLEVHGPGDLDGDGTNDLVFGAPDQATFETPEAANGRAFAFAGR